MFQCKVGKELRESPQSWNKNGRKKAKAIRWSIQEIQFPNKKNSRNVSRGYQTQDAQKSLRTEGPRLEPSKCGSSFSWDATHGVLRPGLPYG